MGYGKSPVCPIFILPMALICLAHYLETGRYPRRVAESVVPDQLLIDPILNRNIWLNLPGIKAGDALNMLRPIWV